jgi:hypothetical protein
MIAQHGGEIRALWRRSRSSGFAGLTLAVALDHGRGAPQALPHQHRVVRPHGKLVERPRTPSLRRQNPVAEGIGSLRGLTGFAALARAFATIEIVAVFSEITSKACQK